MITTFYLVRLARNSVGKSVLVYSSHCPRCMASREDFLILVAFTKGFLCNSRPAMDSDSQDFLEIDRENTKNREIQYLDFSDCHAPWAAARVHQYGLPDRFWCKSDQIKCCYAYTNRKPSIQHS